MRHQANPANAQASVVRGGRRIWFSLGVQLEANIAYRIGRGDFRGLRLAAMTIFEISGCKSPFSDHDPMRDAHELRIRKLHPRPRVAIIQQHVDPGRIELLVQQVGGFLDAGRFLVIDGHQNDLKGRDGIRGQMMPLAS